MSDKELIWKSWQPVDLLNDFAPSELEEEETIAPEGNYQPDELLQAELTRLRQKAEQKGLAQGMARGLEEGKKQGYEEGLSSGRQEGLDQGLAQGLAQAEKQQTETAGRMVQLFETFKTALENLDSVIPSRLVQLSLTAARSVVGKNIAYDNDVLLEKIKRLLKEETLLKGDIQLWVTEDDLAMVSEHLGSTLAPLGWELRGDESILPGGCRMTSIEGEIDATISTRWEELCQLVREDYL